MITWSPADVDAGVQASLLQIYPILLSTLVSIKDHQLATDDIAYALTLCSSPLTIYLVFASFCDLYGAKTRLYERITSYRRVIRAFAILVPFLWLALSITTVLLAQELSDSNTFSSQSDVSPLILLYYFIPSRSRYGPLVYFVVYFFFGLCLFRRRSQVTADTRARAKVGPLRGVYVVCAFLHCAGCVFVNVVPRITAFNSIE